MPTTKSEPSTEAPVLTSTTPMVDDQIQDYMVDTYGQYGPTSISTPDSDEVVGSYDAPEHFSDVSVMNTHYDDIMYLKEKGVVKGYEDGTYEPGGTVTQAEATKMIMEAVGITYTEYAGEAWHAPIMYAANKRSALINDDPHHEVTRGEIAYIMAKLLGLTPTVMDDSLALFTDFTNSTPYADYLTACILQGYFLGDSNTDTLRPQDTLNRGEMATLVVRTMDKLGSLIGDDGGLVYHWMSKIFDPATAKIAQEMYVGSLSEPPSGDYITAWRVGVVGAFGVGGTLGAVAQIKDRKLHVYSIVGAGAAMGVSVSGKSLVGTKGAITDGWSLQLRGTASKGSFGMLAVLETKINEEATRIEDFYESPTLSVDGSLGVLKVNGSASEDGVSIDGGGVGGTLSPSSSEASSSGASFGGMALGVNVHKNVEINLL